VEKQSIDKNFSVCFHQDMEKEGINNSAVRKRTTFLKTFFISASSGALCLFASGCVWFAPLPQKHLPLSSRKIEDFEIVKYGQPTRSEVEAKLGVPDVFCEDLHVSVYAFEKIERPKVKLLFFFIPVGWFHDYTGYRIGFIEFDNHDKVYRSGLETEYGGTFADSLKYDAKNWIADKEKAQPKK
jgi:hypothetical protein